MRDMVGAPAFVPIMFETGVLGVFSSLAPALGEVFPITFKSGVRLVATGSTLGYVGCPSLDNYSACKAALISFARSARRELAAHGITLPPSTFMTGPR